VKNRRVCVGFDAREQNDIGECRCHGDRIDSGMLHRTFNHNSHTGRLRCLLESKWSSGFAPDMRPQPGESHDCSAYEQHDEDKVDPISACQRTPDF